MSAPQNRCCHQEGYTCGNGSDSTLRVSCVFTSTCGSWKLNPSAGEYAGFRRLECLRRRIYPL